MLFTLQRYEFFSKSQLISLFEQYRTRCCLPYKGTNCSANHNGMIHESIIITDVVYPTKVRIFQQITTKAGKFNNGDVMLFTLQRYEFFSKSQLQIISSLTVMRCCLPYKGTNFSANHNRCRRHAVAYRDVVYPTKVRIFQQITTNVYVGRKTARCCLPYKGTNFSANHNS